MAKRDDIKAGIQVVINDYIERDISMDKKTIQSMLPMDLKDDQELIDELMEYQENSQIDYGEIDNLKNAIDDVDAPAWPEETKSNKQKENSQIDSGGIDNFENAIDESAINFDQYSETKNPNGPPPPTPKTSVQQSPLDKAYEEVINKAEKEFEENPEKHSKDALAAIEKLNQKDMVDAVRDNVTEEFQKFGDDLSKELAEDAAAFSAKLAKLDKQREQEAKQKSQKSKKNKLSKLIPKSVKEAFKKNRKGLVETAKKVAKKAKTTFKGRS